MSASIAFNNFAGTRKKPKPIENDEERTSISRSAVPTGSAGMSSTKAGPGGNDEKDSKVNRNSDPVNGNPNNHEGLSDVSRLAIMISQHLLLLEGQSHEGNNISYTGKSMEFEKRRPASLPPCPSKEEQCAENAMMQRPTSELFLSQVKRKGKLELGDPLTSSVLNNLELLEGLGKGLDKEYKCGGEIKCWKHLAGYFGVKAEIYETFTYSQERSPTEDLFELLKSKKPDEFTIGKLKDRLSDIHRQDVQDVLLTHQLSHKQLTDETQVGSLFDSHPNAIGKMAFLLDKETPGRNNWKQLADEFVVPRSEAQNFGESIDDNPTENLFKHLAVKQPRLTIGEVKTHLKGMQDVLDLMTKSNKVSDSSPLKDFWDLDLETAASVCNLLNKKHTCRIRCWRFLGHKLGVKKDVLDDFTKEEDIISPTEVLIRHLDGARPMLTMADLIWALETIGRWNDLRFVVEVYFADGCISKFLQSARIKFGESKQTDV